MDLKDLVREHGDIAAKEMIVKMILGGNIALPKVRSRVDADKIFGDLKGFVPKLKTSPYQTKGHYSPFKLYRDPRDSKRPAKFRNSTLLVDDPEDSYYKYNVIVDVFSEDQRFKSKGVGGMSTEECWKDPDCLRELADVIISKGYNHLTEIALSDSLFDVNKPPGLFRPTWIKGILNAVFGNDYTSHKRMLNMSAGWGSELITAISLGYDYVGFDPNPDLVPAHKGMIERFGDRSKQLVVPTGFEHADLSGYGKFDMVISSPPFYDKEIYTGGEQSVDVYGSFDAWITGFLFQSLSNAWSALKVGGYLIIHMADAFGRNINDPMNLFIEQHIPGSSWEGMIGVSFKENGAYPIWVWKKIDTADTNRVIWNPASQRSLSEMYPGIYNRTIQSYVTSVARSLDSYGAKLEMIDKYVDGALDGQPPAIIKFAKEVVFRDRNNVGLLLLYGVDPEASMDFIKKLVLGLYQMKQ